MSVIERRIAIGTMFALYGIVAFVTTLAAPLANIWKLQPVVAGSNALAMLGNLMNYLGYLLIGAFAGRMLSKIGYKKTILCGTALGFLGILVQWLSGFGGGIFVIYLAGALTSGIALCVLNTAINPMLNTLGGGGAGGNRLNLTGGLFNSICGAITPFLVGALIGAKLRSGNVSLSDVDIVMFLAMGVFALSFFAILFLPILDPPRAEKTHSSASKSPLAFRQCRWGLLGIFLFMGTSIGIAGTLNLWICDPSGLLSSVDETIPLAVIGGFFFSVYVLAMLVGRLIGSFIGGRISPRAMLASAAVLAFCLIIVGLCLTDIIVACPVFTGEKFVMANVSLAAPMLAMAGLATSVMWSSIFSMSTEGLGSATERASGLFMTMVVGGGIIPLLQNYIADIAGFGMSYIVPLFVFGYLVIYSLFLSIPEKQNS